MKNTRFIIKAILLMTMSIAFAANSFGQSGDEVLVEGNPPLTQAMVNGAIRFYERGLAVEFTEYECAMLQDKLVETWKTAQKANDKSLGKLFQVIEKINAWDDAKLKEHQQELSEALLADLKASPRNEFYKYVLKVYKNMNGDVLGRNAKVRAKNSNQTELSSNNDPETLTENTLVESENLEPVDAASKKSKTANQPNFQPVSGAIKMSDLVGKWNKGMVASYGYRDTVTNDYKSGYGSANMHEIAANGSFDYSNYAQISLYGCTTELFTSMKGRATVSGSQVTFKYISGNVKGKDSCKSTGFDKPAQINQTTYRLERDGSNLRLCEIDKENPTCLYKEEK